MVMKDEEVKDLKYRRTYRFQLTSVCVPELRNARFNQSYFSLSSVSLLNLIIMIVLMMVITKEFRKQMAFYSSAPVLCCTTPKCKSERACKFFNPLLSNLSLSLFPGADMQ